MVREDTWEKSSLDKQSPQAKGPEGRAHRVCSGTSRKLQHTPHLWLVWGCVTARPPAWPSHPVHSSVTTLTP